MLLDDDVMADGEPETSAFPRWLGRKKRVEHLFFHVERHASAVVVDSDFHAITKVFGRGSESRLVVITIGLRSTFGRSIESVCNKIKKSTVGCPAEKRLLHRRTD